MTNNTDIYRSEVQLTPQIIDGAMAYYWNVHQIDEKGNKVIVEQSFERTVARCMSKTYDFFLNMGL